MSATRHFTVALDLVGAACLVVGGGPVAARRVRRLLDAGAQVTVVAPQPVDELRRSQVRLIERAYQPEDVGGQVLVITTTGVADVDARVVADAHAAGALVSDATNHTRGSFIVPAIATSGPITVSVDTGGSSPALSKWLRERLEVDLADGYPILVDIMASARAELVAAGQPTESPGWATALDSGLLELVREGRLLAARDRLRTHLGLADPLSPA